MSPILRVAKLTQNAVVPRKGSLHAAGFDLCSAYDYVVRAGDKELVKTDLQVELPYGRVAPRSGLAAKHFIDVGAGVIDRDYRGNIMVVIFNFGKQEFKIRRGDRIAQLICERVVYPEVELVEVLPDNTGRGGFGSTGIQ